MNRTNKQAIYLSNEVLEATRGSVVIISNECIYCSHPSVSRSCVQTFPFLVGPQSQKADITEATPNFYLILFRRQRVQDQSEVPDESSYIFDVRMPSIMYT